MKSDHFTSFDIRSVRNKIPGQKLPHTLDVLAGMSTNFREVWEQSGYDFFFMETFYRQTVGERFIDFLYDAHTRFTPGVVVDMPKSNFIGAHLMYYFDIGLLANQLAGEDGIVMEVGGGIAIPSMVASHFGTKKIANIEPDSSSVIGRDLIEELINGGLLKNRVYYVPAKFEEMAHNLTGAETVISVYPLTEGDMRVYNPREVLEKAKGKIYYFNLIERADFFEKRIVQAVAEKGCDLVMELSLGVDSSAGIPRDARALYYKRLLEEREYNVLLIATGYPMLNTPETMNNGVIFATKRKVIPYSPHKIFGINEGGVDLDHQVKAELNGITPEKLIEALERGIRERKSNPTIRAYNELRRAKEPEIKGKDRNKPCPCGSGIKAKKCCAH